jgi:signal peptidase I
MASCSGLTMVVSRHQRLMSCCCYATTRPSSLSLIMAGAHRRCKTSLSSKGARRKPQHLSRKDRRRMEQEQQKQQRKKEKRRGEEAKATISTPFSMDKLQRFLPSAPRIRIPGGYSSFDRDHWLELAKRLPLWIVLALLVSSEDTSPFLLIQAYGPSMLPTVHPIGDIYLCSTGAWSRLLQTRRQYKVGDVILWRDPETHRSACKRIVGVGGDAVLRYGQHVDKYRDRNDFGILAPGYADMKYDESWDEQERLSSSSTTTRQLHREFTVPADHVWLEGDFPPFSLDSRHYGPVPIDWIHGKLICRVWPMTRKSSNVPDISVSSGQRPSPLSLEEALSGAYNLRPRSVE